MQLLKYVICLQDIFKTGLLAQSEEFKKQVHYLLDEFQRNGPFTSTIGTREALESIRNVQDQVLAFKKTQQEIRNGLIIFKIDQPPNKEIAFLDKVECKQILFISSLCQII
jgi:dynein heavy chain